MINYKELKNTPEFKTMLQCAKARGTTILDFSKNVWTPIINPWNAPCINGWHKTLRMDETGVRIGYDCCIDGEWQLEQSNNCKIIAYQSYGNPDDTSDFYRPPKIR